MTAEPCNTMRIIGGGLAGLACGCVPWPMPALLRVTVFGAGGHMLEPGGIVL